MEMEVAVVGGWRGWREQRWWWVGGEVGENNGGRGDEVGWTVDEVEEEDG